MNKRRHMMDCSNSAIPEEENLGSTDGCPRKARDAHRYRWYWRLRPIRGRWGFNLDKKMVRYTGVSAVLAEVAIARHQHYDRALLLITVGRKSGQLVETVLPYVRHEESFLVFASNDLARKDPDWLLNLREHPACWAYVGREQLALIGHVADDTERPILFEEIRGARPHVIDYERAAAEVGRTIPLVVLTHRLNASV